MVIPQSVNLLFGKYPCSNQSSDINIADNERVKGDAFSNRRQSSSVHPPTVSGFLIKYEFKRPFYCRDDIEFEFFKIFSVYN